MQSTVSEKEFAVINEISNNHLPDQRSIANRVGISLGMTNLIIKRLITKGYVKAKQLDKRKIQYLLTPKGISEKTKKSYNFALKTINLLKSVRKSIDELIEQKYKDGFIKFTVSGSGDLVDMAEMALKRFSKTHDDPAMEFSKISDSKESIILTVADRNNKKDTIDLLQYLSEAGVFYW